MTLQEFVDSLSPEVFKELMAVCIQRVEGTMQKGTGACKTSKEDAVDDVINAIAAVKDKVGSGLVDAKLMFDYVSEAIKQRIKK